MTAVAVLSLFMSNLLFKSRKTQFHGGGTHKLYPKRSPATPNPHKLILPMNRSGPPARGANSTTGLFQTDSHKEWDVYQRLSNLKKVLIQSLLIYY